MESNKAAQPDRPEPTAAIPAATRPPARSTEKISADPEAIRLVLEKTLAERLKPVQASLNSLQGSVAALQREDDTPEVKDIVGGLGWIVGIMGLILYFRRPKNSPKGP